MRVLLAAITVNKIIWTLLRFSKDKKKTEKLSEFTNIGSQKLAHSHKQNFRQPSHFTRRRAEWVSEHNVRSKIPFIFRVAALHWGGMMMWFCVCYVESAAHHVIFGYYARLALCLRSLFYCIYSLRVKYRESQYEKYAKDKEKSKVPGDLQSKENISQQALNSCVKMARHFWGARAWRRISLPQKLKENWSPTFTTK